MFAVSMTPAKAPAATLCTRPPPVFPESSIVPGMAGTGLTAIQGSAPVSFDIQIIGILPNALLPSFDLVIFKIIGPPAFLDQAHGVASGMSGSPIYIDGQLAGAVSYTFGLAADPMIGLFTPAQQMVDLTALPTGAAATSLPSSVAVTHRARVAVAEAARVPVSSVPTTVQRLAIPLGVSGLSDQRAQRLQSIIDQHGLPFHVYPAGGAASTSAATINPTPLEPGEPLAAELSTGDVTFAGIGTATFACGDLERRLGPLLLSPGPELARHGGRERHHHRERREWAVRAVQDPGPHRPARDGGPGPPGRADGPDGGRAGIDTHHHHVHEHGQREDADRTDGHLLPEGVLGSADRLRARVPEPAARVRPPREGHTQPVLHDPGVARGRRDAVHRPQHQHARVRARLQGRLPPPERAVRAGVQPDGRDHVHERRGERRDHGSEAHRRHRAGQNGELAPADPLGPADPEGEARVRDHPRGHAAAPWGRTGSNGDVSDAGPPPGHRVRAGLLPRRTGPSTNQYGPAGVRAAPGDPERRRASQRPDRHRPGPPARPEAGHDGGGPGIGDREGGGVGPDRSEEDRKLRTKPRPLRPPYRGSQGRIVATCSPCSFQSGTSAYSSSSIPSGSRTYRLCETP